MSVHDAKRQIAISETARCCRSANRSPGVKHGRLTREADAMSGEGSPNCADHYLGRSRGGLTTKIHVVADVQGAPNQARPDRRIGARRPDCRSSARTSRSGTIGLADKAYDADCIRELTEGQRATPNIPPKSNRRWKPCFSKRLYRECNLIERFSSRLKHFRRVATRYGKLADYFLAMIQLASMRLWLRAYESTT